MLELNIKRCVHNTTTFLINNECSKMDQGMVKAVTVRFRGLKELTLDKITLLPVLE
uniref:Uncharacterized protein n=1 Tax=Lepeophtheirus salmonis TaxID=72036 RepID=A0A0K2VD08_LEPSM